MAEFEQDAADFQADLEKLSISQTDSTAEIADLIGYSKSHTENVLYGVKRYSPGLRTKIQGLIAAKGDGPVEVVSAEWMEKPHPVRGDAANYIANQENRFVASGRDVHCEVILRSVWVGTFASEGCAEEYAEWRNQDEGE